MKHPTGEDEASDHWQFRWTNYRLIIAAGTLIVLALAAMTAVIVFRSIATGHSAPKYSNNELGISELTKNYYHRTLLWQENLERSETLVAGSVGIEDFLELRGHERERAYFEFVLESVMSDALETLSGDLDYYSGDLATSYLESLDECARQSGLDRGLEDLSEVSISSGSSVPTRYTVVRNQCADYAAGFPDLQAARRDSLLARTYAHLYHAVEVWLEEHPEAAVPMEYAPGAPQPFADSLVEICLASATPAQCAQDVGVNLPPSD